MKSETKFKRWFLGQWKGWSESYEPRAGSGMGIPDIQLLVGSKLLPVECKVGEWVRGNLMVSEIRPAQISWHHRFQAAGGRSCFVVGVDDDGKWAPWVVPVLDLVSSGTNIKKGIAARRVHMWSTYIEAFK
jgi:hypothetical protein